MANAHAAEQAAGPVVERFARGAAHWLGYFGIVMGVVTAGAAMADGLSNWRVLGVGAAISLISWVVLVRPEASLHQNGVLFRNMLRDVFIPSSKIEAAHTGQTLMVRAEAVVYHSPAVTRSARSQIKEKHGRTSMMGPFGSLGVASAEPQAPKDYRFGEELRSSTSYESYVESRILTASRDAEPDDRQVVVSWARLPAAALGFSALALIALFV